MSLPRTTPAPHVAQSEATALLERHAHEARALLERETTGAATSEPLPTDPALLLEHAAEHEEQGRYAEAQRLKAEALHVASRATPSASTVEVSADPEVRAYRNLAATSPDEPALMSLVNARHLSRLRALGVNQ